MTSTTPVPGIDLTERGWIGLPMPPQTPMFKDVTLRDWFAGTCPSDICNTSAHDQAGEFYGGAFPEDGTIEEQATWNVQVEAKMRYLYADAMLAERAK